MVELRRGDLFESGAEAIVNTINCVGVMGKGIALLFKQRYPDMFRTYVKYCNKKLIRVGKMWVWHTGEPDYRYIFNFPTKDDWRNPSKLEWISSGLDDLKNCVIMMGVESIAMPALGCTNGGLNFGDVRALVEEKLNDLEIPVILFEPQ